MKFLEAINDKVHQCSDQLPQTCSLEKPEGIILEKDHTILALQKQVVNGNSKVDKLKNDLLYFHTNPQIVTDFSEF